MIEMLMNTSCMCISNKHTKHESESQEQGTYVLFGTLVN